MTNKKSETLIESPDSVGVFLLIAYGHSTNILSNSQHTTHNKRLIFIDILHPILFQHATNYLQHTYLGLTHLDMLIFCYKMIANRSLL